MPHMQSSPWVWADFAHRGMVLARMAPGGTTSPKPVQSARRGFEIVAAVPKTSQPLRSARSRSETQAAVLKRRATARSLSEPFQGFRSRSGDPGAVLKFPERPRVLRAASEDLETTPNIRQTLGSLQSLRLFLAAVPKASQRLRAPESRFEK